MRLVEVKLIIKVTLEHVVVLTSNAASQAIRDLFKTLLKMYLLFRLGGFMAVDDYRSMAEPATAEGPMGNVGGDTDAWPNLSGDGQSLQKTVLGLINVLVTSGLVFDVRRTFSTRKRSQ